MKTAKVAPQLRRRRTLTDPAFGECVELVRANGKLVMVFGPTKAEAEKRAAKEIAAAEKGRAA
jgi:hypothetical protein